MHSNQTDKIRLLTKFRRYYSASPAKTTQVAVLADIEENFYESAALFLQPVNSTNKALLAGNLYDDSANIENSSSVTPLHWVICLFNIKKQQPSDLTFFKNSFCTPRNPFH